MAFSSNPAILDLAAVLEAHSTLSPECRLYATMCYWYAGSTYEVIKSIYNGHNEDSEHVQKVGKLGIITSYRAIREKQDAQDMGSLVDSVKQQLNNDKKNIIPEEEPKQVARAELERIPMFEALLQRSRERKDQVMAVLEKRESERIRIASQGQELEVKDRELTHQRIERSAVKQQLEAKDRELERLREQLEALQSAGNSNK